VTPTSYLELVNTFKDLLSKKRGWDAISLLFVHDSSP
jgi:hypothetical protein